MAPLAGACFLIWVDVAARLLAAPEELPLGVITAALGVPCFVFLMRGRGYVFGEVVDVQLVESPRNPAAIEAFAKYLAG